MPQVHGLVQLQLQVQLQLHEHPQLHEQEQEGWHGQDAGLRYQVGCAGLDRDHPGSGPDLISQTIDRRGNSAVTFLLVDILPGVC